MTSLAILSGLFWSALLAATVLPGASELVLIAILMDESVDPVLAVVVAGTGNTLGSAVNWIMGRYFASYSDRTWFPVPADLLARAEGVFQRYGTWTLLFAWWPFGGDALTLAAGLLRVGFPTFLFYVAIGKFARYAVVGLSTMQVQGLM